MTKAELQHALTVERAKVLQLESELAELVDVLESAADQMRALRERHKIDLAELSDRAWDLMP